MKYGKLAAPYIQASGTGKSGNELSRHMDKLAVTDKEIAALRDYVEGHGK